MSPLAHVDSTPGSEFDSPNIAAAGSVPPPTTREQAFTGRILRFGQGESTSDDSIPTAIKKVALPTHGWCDGCGSTKVACTLTIVKPCQVGGVFA